METFQQIIRTPPWASRPEDLMGAYARLMGRFRFASGLNSVLAQDLVGHRSDVHWLLLRDEVVVARCSLWWTEAPALGEEVVGAIGHYAAADGDAAGRLLAHACDALQNQGCTIAVGPMDGNTWRKYRFVTERGSEPPFFLEPDNPDDYPAHFVEAGFHPLAHYYSALCTDLTYQDPRLERVRPRMEAQGVYIRAIDPKRFEEELRAIYEISLISFRDNFLYTPVSEEEFLGQYHQILPWVRPELVLMAEQEGKLVGFLFALPDLLQAKRGEPIDTLIVKTAAVLPGRAYAGLGNLLTVTVQQAAHALGYRRSVHALMHESNESRAVSGHYAVPFRRYTLYSRPLSSR